MLSLGSCGVHRRGSLARRLSRRRSAYPGHDSRIERLCMTVGSANMPYHQMAKRRAELDLLALRLQKENAIIRYRAQFEENSAIKRIKAAETINNAQRQHGALLEAHRRLPAGLQREAFQQLRVLTARLQRAKAAYSDLPQMRTGQL